jgi:hypothetical protein
VTYIAVHPYAKWPKDNPATPENEDVIGVFEAYAYHNKPIMVTEFGWPSPNWQAQGEWFSGMLNRMDDHPLIKGLINYCADDLMNPNFGLMSWGTIKPSGHALRAYSESKGLMPRPTVPIVPVFVLGFKEWHDIQPELIGDPIENEYGGIHQWSQQLTTTGLLSWADLKAGQQMLFYHFPTKTRYRWDGRKGIPL